MKTILLVRAAILVLTISTLSGCLLVPVDEGRRGGNYHERDGEGHYGEHHEGPGDRR